MHLQWVRKCHGKLDLPRSALVIVTRVTSHPFTVIPFFHLSYREREKAEAWLKRKGEGMREVSFPPPLCLLFLLRSSSCLAHAHISLWEWSNVSWPEDTFPPSSKNDVIFFAFTSFPPPQMNTHLSGCSRGSQADIKNFLEESFPISLLVKMISPGAAQTLLQNALCVWQFV